MSNTDAGPVDRPDRTPYQGRSPIGAVLSRLIWLVFGAIEVIIAVRFVLELLGANAQAGFVQLVYSVSDIFMAPFNAIFATQHVAGARVEWSALVAIVVYALIAWGLDSLVRALTLRRLR
jgi:YGGT family